MQSIITNPNAPIVSRPSRLTSSVVVVAWSLSVMAQAGRLVYLLPVKRVRYPIGTEPALESSDLVGSASFLLVATFGALIILRASERRFGWLMLALGFSQAFVGFAAEYSQFALLVAPHRNMPLGSFAGWLQDLWTISLVLIFFLLPALFPDGKLPSRRWRSIFWSVMTAWSLFILIFAFAQRPLANVYLDLETAPPNPLGILPGNALLFNIAFAVLVATSIMIGIASVISRWRSANPELRLQIKWLVYAFLLMLMTTAASLTNTILREGAGIDLGLENAIGLASDLSLFAIIGALGVAVLKYRLYNIDLLINRTLVYGVLTAMIIAAYVLFVAGVGALIPVQNNLFLSLLVTGVIAVLFNPLRMRLQHGVNRLMFGESDDPYTVLSQLGRLLSSSAAPDATLQTVVETIGTALRLPYAAIQIEQNGTFRTSAEYGETEPGQVELPLVHQNQLVGRLVVASRTHGESLSHRDRQLLEDIAHQAAAVAHTVRLTEALQSSRQQLVTAREEERRRLRRDLHDGLGPTLASHTLKLDMAMDLIPNEPDAAIDQLQDLYGQTQEIVADIRRLVHQLRPPTLDDLGLVGAVQAHIQHIRRAGKQPEITLESPPEGLPPLTAAAELAAYRITMEAVTNVIRHAQAQNCWVSYSIKNGLPNKILEIQVLDDGQGFPEPIQSGVGMNSMRERAEELGGRVTVEPVAGSGMRVHAELPLLEEGDE